MKALNWKVCLGALLLSATTAFAALVPEPAFLLPVAASKGGETKPVRPGFSLSAWLTCTFNCADESTNYANCNTSLTTVAACCHLAGNPSNPNPDSCGQHGGLASGSCTDGTTTTYCP
jgi:hypothetical protein